MFDEDAPTRVAITGIAGYLGRELAAQFDVDSSIDSVVGLDVAPYTAPSPKVRFFQRSVEQPFEDLFREQRVNAAVHLAFVSEPSHDRAREERVNVEGTKNFLDACAKAKVKTVLVASSAAAYGARADNPEVLYEGAPLRATSDLPCAHDKIRVEDLCYEFVKKNPDVALQIVRPCVVIGPHMSNFLSRLIEGRFLLLPRGANPPVQFIHEDDCVRVLARLLRSRKVGVFNLAADGAITLRKIAELAGRRVVRLPRFLLRWLVGLGWRLGWRWLTEAPPGYLDYVTHPWIVSNIKLKTELFFIFKHDASRAVRDYLDRDLASSERRALTRDDDDIDDLDELEEIEAPEPPRAAAPPPSAAESPDEKTPRLAPSSGAAPPTPPAPASFPAESPTPPPGAPLAAPVTTSEPAPSAAAATPAPEPSSPAPATPAPEPVAAPGAAVPPTDGTKPAEASALAAPGTPPAPAAADAPKS